MRRFPALLQLSTRLFLAEIGARLARPATLDDIGDAELDAWRGAGFSMVWLLGVWQTGERSRQVSLSHASWQAAYREALPDLREDDVCGSCFAVCAYEVHRDFGGDEALARLRARLARRGLGLLLDFVPNHVGLDHPWLDQHPEFFIAGKEAELAAHPDRYTRVASAGGARILAQGRDPYFPGWPDTLQLNYAEPALQAAMQSELQRIARRCDGVRCDMAMLILPDVFQRTWGLAMQPFWPGAIAAVRAEAPSFVFLAEVYWDLELTLQQQGFDFTYDKRLYDLLSAGQARPVREHLGATLEPEARFLENHDEPRAAAQFAPELLRAAAVICYCTPGLRLFQHGQREGKRVRVPVHLARAPHEADDAALVEFYARLLCALHQDVFHQGQCQLLPADPAWPDNPSYQAFIAFVWSGPADARRLIVVNYAPHASQCYVRLPWSEPSSGQVRLRDRLHDVTYERDAAALRERGLYLDLPAWGCHLFELG